MFSHCICAVQATPVVSVQACVIGHTTECWVIEVVVLSVAADVVGWLRHCRRPDQPATVFQHPRWVRQQQQHWYQLQHPLQQL